MKRQSGEQDPSASELAEQIAPEKTIKNIE